MENIKEKINSISTGGQGYLLKLNNEILCICNSLLEANQTLEKISQEIQGTLSAKYKNAVLQVITEEKSIVINFTNKGYIYNSYKTFNLAVESVKKLNANDLITFGLGTSEKVEEKLVEKPVIIPEKTENIPLAPPPPQTRSKARKLLSN